MPRTPLHAPWSSNAERNWACLLLLFAVLVRCWFPEWIEFRGDERLALLSTRAALEQGQCLHGLQASNGLLLGPFLIYLLAPVVALTHDPVLVTSWVMLLNLGALAALFVLLRAALGARLAVLGTALFAALPMASIFARRLWAPDLLLPLTLPLLCALLFLARRYSRSMFLCATALFALACQIHPSAWFLGPGLLLAALLLRLRPPRIDVLVAALLVLLLYSPYLVHELRTDFDDVRFFLHARASAGAQSPGFWRLLSEHASLDLGLSSGSALGLFLGPSRMQWIDASRWGALLGGVRVGLWFVCAFSVLWCTVRVARALLRGRADVSMSEGERVPLLAVSVIATTSPAYALLGVLPEAHYHVLLIPLVAICLLVSLADLFGPARARWLTPAISLLVFSQILLSFEARRASLFSNSEGLFVPLEAEPLRRLRAELPLDLDRELERRAHFADTQSALALRFEASTHVLLCFDAPTNDPAAHGTGAVRVAAGSEGLVVTGSTVTDMLVLPEFPPAMRGRAMLRLELSSPASCYPLVFHSHPGERDLSRARVVDAWIPAGRNTLYVELPDRQACGPLSLRVLVYRYVVHAAEVREVEP